MLAPMRVLKCILCGEELRGDTREALTVALEAHAVAHGDDEEDRERIPALVEAAFGAGWDGLLRPLPPDIETRPLAPELEPDFLAFFEGEAFADNPGWAMCYCMAYKATGPAWDTATAAENRAEQSRQIRSGEAHGILAFAGGKPVGWCHVAPRASLVRLASRPDAATEPVASIVCFVVPPMYRRQGLAGRMLDAAVDYARSLGLRTIEAYPARETVSDARAYHGPLELYLGAGFVEAGEWGPYVVVRRDL